MSVWFLLPLCLQEMTTDFDNVLRLREHEFNLRMDTMRTEVLSHEIKVWVRACVRAWVPLCLKSCNAHVCVYIADRNLYFLFIMTLKRYTLQLASMQSPLYFIPSVHMFVEFRSFVLIPHLIRIKSIDCAVGVWPIVRCDLSLWR